MLIMSNMGDQVWLITSRQTDPDSSSIFAGCNAAREHESVSLSATGSGCVESSGIAPIGSKPPRTRAVRVPSRLTVENLVHEADARRFVRVAIGKLDVNFPHSSSEWSCEQVNGMSALLHVLLSH